MLPPSGKSVQKNSLLHLAFYGRPLLSYAELLARRFRPCWLLPLFITLRGFPTCPRIFSSSEVWLSAPRPPAASSVLSPKATSPSSIRAPLFPTAAAAFLILSAAMWKRWKACAPHPPGSSVLRNSSVTCATSMYSSAPAR